MTRTLTTEIARVRDHFDGALALLDMRETRTLDRAAQLTRALLRRALVEYQAEGVFPLNHDFAGMRPAFIDSHGTRCAMAHLMELGGAGDLVAEVAQNANHAYVDELAVDPRFTAWLDAAGLTVEEAARIQPGYGCISAADCLCTITSATATPAAAVVEVTINARSESEGTVTGVVDVVHGTSATVKVGDTVTAKRNRVTVDDGNRVLVPLGQVNGAYEVLAVVAADGMLGDQCGATPSDADFPNQSGRGKVGPISVTDLMALRDGTRATCESTLTGKDKCFGVCDLGPEGDGNARKECVYGAGPAVDAGAPVADAGAVVTTPSPSADAGTSSGTTASPAPTDDGGCSTTGASGPTSVAVLLAVAGAMIARRRLVR